MEKPEKNQTPSPAYFTRFLTKPSSEQKAHSDGSSNHGFESLHPYAHASTAHQFRHYQFKQNPSFLLSQSQSPLSVRRRQRRLRLLRTENPAFVPLFGVVFGFSCQERWCHHGTVPDTPVNVLPIEFHFSLLCRPCLVWFDLIFS